MATSTSTAAQPKDKNTKPKDKTAKPKKTSTKAPNPVTPPPSGDGDDDDDSSSSDDDDNDDNGDGGDKSDDEDSDNDAPPPKKKKKANDGASTSADVKPSKTSSIEKGSVHLCRFVVLFCDPGTILTRGYKMRMAERRDKELPEGERL